MKNELIFRVEDLNLKPTRANLTDAGIDLRAKQNYSLLPNTRILVGTGISVAIPYEHVGLLIARSSLSKKGIILTNSVGVIDSDYRGEIMASLMFLRNSKEHLVLDEQIIEKYERIVQLIITPIKLLTPMLYMGLEEDWLKTTRSNGGFGSTGKF